MIFALRINAVNWSGVVGAGVSPSRGRQVARESHACEQ
jgi:hypothetical protein